MTNIRTLLLALALVGASQALPATVEAADALRLNAETGIFTVNFEFQTAEEEYRVPVFTSYNSAFESSTGTVGYTLSDTQLPTGFNRAGLVLSNQPREGNFYVIPPETRGVFTMVVFAMVPPTAPSTELQVDLTNLPYQRGTDEDAEQRFVSAADLTNFSTPSITLGGQTMTPVTSPIVTPTIPTSPQK